jgi:hypothetical protein
MKSKYLTCLKGLWSHILLPSPALSPNLVVPQTYIQLWSLLVSLSLPICSLPITPTQVSPAQANLPQPSASSWIPQGYTHLCSGPALTLLSFVHIHGHTYTQRWMCVCFSLGYTLLQVTHISSFDHDICWVLGDTGIGQMSIPDLAGTDTEWQTHIL